MKTTTKNIISSISILSLLMVNSAFAAGFPSEPMVIYGNIEGLKSTTDNTLKIYDGNDAVLTEIPVSGNAYGTNKTFDLANKIILNPFDGSLIFKINDIDFKSQLGETSQCNDIADFQKGGICEYTLIGKSAETIEDLNNIPEEEKSESFEDVFDGKILEKTREEIKDDIGDNIVKNSEDAEEIIVSNRDITLSGSTLKEVVIISGSVSEAVHIPKNTTINQSDAIIETPVEIADKTKIKNKIKREIIGAVDVPTNKQITFNKNIRICTKSYSAPNNPLFVYYSHDNENWTLDTSVSDLTNINNQICFNVNHLTSFAIGGDAISSGSTTTSSSGGGGGGGWAASPTSYCNANELICTKLGAQYKWLAITGNNCTVPSYKTTCKESDIIDLGEIDETVENIETNITHSKAIDEKINTKTSYEVSSNTIVSNTKKTIQAKDYIVNLKKFNSLKKEQKTIHNMRVLNIKGDTSYNDKITAYTNEIYADIKIDSIRKHIIKYMDQMTTTYGVSIDDSLSDEHKVIYAEQLQKDSKKFNNMLVVLKRKDSIINRTLEKRKAKNTSSLGSSHSDYSVAVHSIKFKSDIEFKHDLGFLSQGDKLTLIKDYGTYIKATVVSTNGNLMNKQGYISKKYLRK